MCLNQRSTFCRSFGQLPRVTLTWHDYYSRSTDANISYHDLQGFLYENRDGKGRINPNCGRVIQLAMDPDQNDIVRLLLKFGVDINLAQFPPTVPSMQNGSKKAMAQDEFRFTSGSIDDLSVIQ